MSTKRANTSAKRSCFVILALIALYMGVRGIIFYIFPAHDFDLWVVNDTLMDLPRAFFGSVVLVYGLRRFSWRDLGLTKSGFLMVLCFLLWSLVVLAIDGAMRTSYHLSGRQILILSLSSLVVGFSEEVVFRGVGLAALKEWKGEAAAVWISALVFTFYHWGAQPLVEWPAIFFFGLLVAQLRILGVSLYWLILYHAVYDSAWFMLDGYGGWKYRWIAFTALSALAPLGLMLARRGGWAERV